jgi:ParB/Sulfiredoxin domain
VSEFESRSVVPPFVPTVRPEAFHDDDFEAAEFPEETGFRREGLPPGFRMRHDAHYVEQLTGRSTAPHVRVIPLRDIESPRSNDAADLDSLMRSIQAHGVLQPILVRPRGGRFDLITGRKRLAAAHAAGLGEIPCLVHHADHVRARAGRSIVVEIAQHSWCRALSAGQFFDITWIDRPGGYQAAAELAAAQKVAVLHRGGIEVLPGDRGGRRLVMILPQP